MSARFLSFGEYLTQFMEKHGYSGNALARLLEEKSATIISRIKADQCTLTRCEQFLQQLQAAFPDMTDEETACFRRGLVILQLGKDGYYSYRSIHELVTQTPLDTPCSGSLHELLLPPDHVESYSVLCMQCSDPAITDELAALCKLPIPNLSIRHYLTRPSVAPTARLVTSLLPVLCDSRYSLTRLRFAGEAPRLGITAQQFILIRTVCGGDVSHKVLIPDANGNAISLTLADDMSFERCEQCIAELDCEHLPYKIQYDMTTPSDIITFLYDSLKRELNHATCMFKRDFCISFIPIDVLQSALNDMLPHLPPEYKRFVTELRRLSYGRLRAVAETTQPIHVLFSKSALRKFVTTGMLTDHFFGLRPFSREERIRILQYVISLAESNPNITYYLAKDDALFKDYDFYIYEKDSVLITPAWTDYRSNPAANTDGHIELVLSDPAMNSQMYAYFIRYLLPTHALSADESLAFLRNLLPNN